MASFLQLPSHVVESILGYLKFQEVTAMRGLCRRLMECCGRIVRVGMRKLKRDIFSELMALQMQLMVATDPDAVLLRVLLLRCYNVLEMLRAELNLLRALTRRVLVREDVCFPAGHLLDKYIEILGKVKSRDIPNWTLDNDVTSGLMQLSKKFLDGFMAEEHEEDPRLGVHIVDLLDTLIASGYNLTVTYDKERWTCHLSGEYELCDVKFLSLPPDISTVDDGHLNGPLEARKIVEYLINIVRFNNRLYLREEQYWREMEATRRAQQALQQQGYALSPAPRIGVISRQPREYFTHRLCRERKMVSENVIRETYREHGGRKCPFKGFWCRINLTCSLDGAPFELMENWNRIYFEMYAGRNVEFATSDTNVNIRAFLQTPDPSSDVADIDEEEELEVYFLTNENSDPKVAPTSVVDTQSCSSSRTERYSTLVELRVSIPMRAYEAEVYGMFFRDGEHLDESEIRDTADNDNETE